MALGGEGLLRFAKAAPPIELLAAVFRAWLYARCTTARLNHPVEECRLCDAAGGDNQVHYLACDATRRRMHDRLRLTELRDADSAQRTFLSVVGSSRLAAMKVPFALDAINFTVDAKRHGAPQAPIAICDSHV